jgi:hypothetical protein
MPKSEAVRIAEIKSHSEMIHDVRDVLTDPLWSSVLGFIVIHEARKADLVGPVADDLLYAGVIAINTTRAGITREVRTGVQGVIQSMTGALESAVKMLPTAAASLAGG